MWGFPEDMTVRGSLPVCRESAQCLTSHDPVYWALADQLGVPSDDEWFFANCTSYGAPQLCVTESSPQSINFLCGQHFVESGPIPSGDMIRSQNRERSERFVNTLPRVEIAGDLPK